MEKESFRSAERKCFAKIGEKDNARLACNVPSGRGEALLIVLLGTALGTRRNSAAGSNAELIMHSWRGREGIYRARIYTPIAGSIEPKRNLASNQLAFPLRQSYHV